MNHAPDRVLTRLSYAAQSPRLLVITDFDGTLAELVDHPADARPVSGAIETLEKIAELPGVATAILSARSLRDLRVSVGPVLRTRLLGSFGLEQDEPRQPPRPHPDDDTLAHVAMLLSALSAGFPGAWVERKPYAITYHVRLVREDHREEAVARARRAVEHLDGLTESTGKDTLEFLTVPICKGRTLERLRQEHNATAVIYLGDDDADEDAFARLHPTDVGIKVGLPPTAAHHTAPTPAAAVALLKAIHALRTPTHTHTPSKC